MEFEISGVRVTCNHGIYRGENPAHRTAFSVQPKGKNSFEIIIFDTTLPDGHPERTVTGWVNTGTLDDAVSAASRYQVTRPVSDITPGRDPVHVFVELYGGNLQDVKVFADTDAFNQYVVNRLRGEFGEEDGVTLTGDLEKDAEQLIEAAEAAREEMQDGSQFYFERDETVLAEAPEVDG